MLTNAHVAELLARQAETESGILVRAYRRAARSALSWSEMAAVLVNRNEPLTTLRGVGPFIAKRIRGWIEQNAPIKSKPPAIRRDFLTMAEVMSLLQKNSSWRELLRGDLQMHTRWSDGSGTISDMKSAAAERGYEYIAITDHSKGLKIAGGIDESALQKQAAEIQRANSRQPKNPVVLRSIELNLNPRGEGDMDPRSLRRLDLVLGSFHSSLRKSEDQTERYLAALRNPDIQILGHPQGRIYNFRAGLKADWSRVFAEATQLNKAVEIDCYPDRQDLSLRLLEIARDAGTRISLGTDAHHPWQFEFISLGLGAALRIRIPAEKIINFLSHVELKNWIASIRAQSGKGNPRW